MNKNKFAVLALFVTIYVPIFFLVYDFFVPQDLDGILWTTFFILSLFGVVGALPFAIVRLLRSKQS